MNENERLPEIRLLQSMLYARIYFLLLNIFPYSLRARSTLRNSYALLLPQFYEETDYFLFSSTKNSRIPTEPNLEYGFLARV